MMLRGIFYIIRYFFFFITVYLIIFALTNLIPTDPARMLLGPLAPEQEVIRLRKKLGLDEPLYVRFVKQTKILLRGDFGYSYFYREPVSSIVKREFKPSILRSLITLVFSLTLGYILGIFFFHISREKFLEYLYTTSMIPSFLWELFVLWLFSLIGISVLTNGIIYEIVTILISSFYPASYAGVTLMRVIDDQFNTKWYPIIYQSKGFSRTKTIILSSKVSFPQIISIAISSYGIILTSVFFGEYIYNLNGFGTVMFSAILRKDMNIVVAGTLITSLIILTLYIIGEIIIYSTFPQIRSKKY